MLLKESQYSKMQLRSQVLGSSQGKEGVSEVGSSGFGPITPNKRSGSRHRKNSNFSLSDLPDEVILHIICKQSNVKTLCLFSACSKRLSALVSVGL